MILRLLNITLFTHSPLLKRRPYCTSNCSLSDHVVQRATRRAHERRVMHAGDASCMRATRHARRRCIVHPSHALCTRRCVVHAVDASCMGSCPASWSCWRYSSQ
ncbi:hypothetical protein BJV77DRAFT_197452 [Russula vinacea]|nr:hypothetical protein BJV77DRAFT_197452 [Russula vinacea]